MAVCAAGLVRIGAKWVFVGAGGRLESSGATRACTRSLACLTETEFREFAGEA